MPARLAVDPDGVVVRFVLDFHAGHGGCEIGPIGTVPQWRGRGVSSALLGSVLVHCRDEGIAPITLLTDVLRAVATDLDLAKAPTVVVDADPASWWWPDDAVHNWPEWDDLLVDELWERSHAVVPLPDTLITHRTSVVEDPAPSGEPANGRR